MSLSKQELISAATKVDPEQKYFIGVARGTQRRYQKASEEGDPYRRFTMEMHLSQKEGLNIIVGGWIERFGKTQAVDLLLRAVTLYDTQLREAMEAQHDSQAD